MSVPVRLCMTSGALDIATLPWRLLLRHRSHRLWRVQALLKRNNLTAATEMGITHDDDDDDDIVSHIYYYIGERLYHTRRGDGIHQVFIPMIKL